MGDLRTALGRLPSGPGPTIARLKTWREGRTLMQQKPVRDASGICVLPDNVTLKVDTEGLGRHGAREVNGAEVCRNGMTVRARRCGSWSYVMSRLREKIEQVADAGVNAGRQGASPAR